MSRRKLCVRIAVVSVLTAALAWSSTVSAKDDDPVSPSSPEPNNDAQTTAPQPPAAAVAPSDPTPPAATTIAPAPPPPPVRAPVFAADPIADGVLILGAASFAGLLDLINSTGELRPQQISPTFDRSQLLSIDRGAISQTVDGNARTFSNIGLFAACAYAVIDPVISGLREKSVQTALVDAVIYAEAISFTWGVTNLAKMAVRRPRPQAYLDAEAHKNDPNYSNSDTDSSLSFFSGHASMTASVSATATYIAFARAGASSPRPWITLGVGTALTTFVSIERVRGGAHFPTDVIAGAIAGAGIGVVVSHLHRNQDSQARHVWVGFTPAREGGGVAQLHGEL